MFTKLDNFNDDDEELGMFKRLNSKVGHDATKIEAFKGTLMTDFDDMSSKSSSVSSVEDVGRGSSTIVDVPSEEHRTNIPQKASTPSKEAH